MTDSPDVATTAEALRLEGEFQTSERDWILEHCSNLDHRLRSYRAGSVEMALTLKERDTPSQRMTLETWISGRPRLVATSNRAAVEEAVVEVRDNMIRQLTDQKNRTEPRQNRHLRETGD
mgnify:FL=1